MNRPAVRVREALPDDAGAIARIYNEGIEDRVATFETRPRSSQEIRDWFGDHPIVVVEQEGEIVAFASSSRWRQRECYAGIAELSVYVARSHRRRGAGRLALDGLIEAATRRGLRKLLAALLAGNEPSRALMVSAGFREVGRYEKQAQLEGVWRDVLLFEKLLPV